MARERNIPVDVGEKHEGYVMGMERKRLFDVYSCTRRVDFIFSDSMSTSKHVWPQTPSLAYLIASLQKYAILIKMLIINLSVDNGYYTN